MAGGSNVYNVYFNAEKVWNIDGKSAADEIAQAAI